MMKVNKSFIMVLLNESMEQLDYTTHPLFDVNHVLYEMKHEHLFFDDHLCMWVSKHHLFMDHIYIVSDDVISRQPLIGRYNTIFPKIIQLFQN